MARKKFNMISIIVFLQVVSFSTLTSGTDIPVDSDTEFTSAISNSTTSLFDVKDPMPNTTEKEIDNHNEALNSSKGKYISLTKDLVVEDTGKAKELVILDPASITTLDALLSDLTSEADVSVIEDIPLTTFRTITNSQDNKKERILEDGEMESSIQSTETLYYNPNSTTRMLRHEDSPELSPKIMPKATTLTTPNFSNTSEIRHYTDLVPTESLENLTSFNNQEKFTKPHYFTTKSEGETEEEEKKTQMTTIKMSEKLDEMNGNMKNDDPKVSANYEEIPFESTATKESQHDLNTSKFDFFTLSEKHEGEDGFYVNSKEAATNDHHTEHPENTTLPINFEIENLENRSVDEDSSKEVKLTVNSTRIPKRIQNKQDRYPEGMVRPARPDPGYTHHQEPDLVRPYRPDSPINQYPYYRPTPDYRTPVIRQDTDYTRPARPDPESQRASFRPNYSYSKTSQEDRSSTRQPSSDSATPKPYRPSFNRPYVPQSSFGRPYRPDYQRPSSKPSAGVTFKPSTSGSSVHDLDLFEHSRADYDYTRQSESVPIYSKNSATDKRRPVNSELPRPYTANRPSYDAITDEPTQLNPLSIDSNIKVSKPSIETGRPPSFYPKPGFGSNYFPSDTSSKPFSIGTVVSAKNLTRVEYIKADCFDNHMKVTMRFNGTFDGLIYSSGYTQDSSCNYVNGSGRNHYEFFIRLNRCGTLGQQEVSEGSLGPLTRKRQERAQYLVNTITVQYNAVIEEDIDEHFRVTCEYGYDFWKTVTFPVINVESASVKLRTGSPVVFTLPPPQCNMEIRSGFGPSGLRISGPVNVGDPITLVIHMKSESTGFDILVSNCFAHNGAQKRLQLIDSHGCVVQEKLISPFRGVSSPDRSQQVTLYSYLKAFRFTGSPALYLECDVHMCHGSCPPQRCYWRNLYKRSAEEMTTKSTTTTESESVVSESVSLFQALEVRHVEVDSPAALRNLHWQHEDDMVCIKTAGFATIFACILLLLLLSTSAAVCMCWRMRKMKSYMETPDTKHFADFDGHIPLK